MKLLVISSVCLLLLFSIVMPHSFADHGSSGGKGGGCSGDCFPPSMGILENLNQGVSGGLSINGKSFDVSLSHQSIPTQTFSIGEPIDVSLSIYENSGAFYLTYVNLKLGQKDVLVSGQLIPKSSVEIVWEKTLDGKESFYVIGDEFIKDVKVTSFVDGDPVIEKITNITFHFTPIQSFNANPMVVNMWDYNRNAWTNYFDDALDISSKSVNLASDMTYSKNHTSQIPVWIKNNAGFWANNSIDDSTFVAGIKYCIDKNIIQIPDLPRYIPEDVLPFVDPNKGPQHYIDRYNTEPSYKDWFDTHYPEHTIEDAVGLNHNSKIVIPEWIKNNAGWWAKDQIDDESFISGIKFLVENGIIIV